MKILVDLLKPVKHKRLMPNKIEPYLDIIMREADKFGLTDYRLCKLAGVPQSTLSKIRSRPCHMTYPIALRFWKALERLNEGANHEAS